MFSTVVERYIQGKIYLSRPTCTTPSRTRFVPCYRTLIHTINHKTNRVFLAKAGQDFEICERRRSGGHQGVWAVRVSARVSVCTTRTRYLRWRT